MFSPSDREPDGTIEGGQIPRLEPARLTLLQPNPHDAANPGLDVIVYGRAVSI